MNMNDNNNNSQFKIIKAKSTESDERITPHFLWKELLISSNYPELADELELTLKDQINYYHLISSCLEPERQFSGVITRITQGKRSEEMYHRLKSDGYFPSISSQHFCEGKYDCAIDFEKIVYINNKIDIKLSIEATEDSFNWLSFNRNGLFGQMYYSAPNVTNELFSVGFIHIGSLTETHKGKTWRK